MKSPFKGVAIAVLITGAIVGVVYLAKRKPTPVPIPIEQAMLPMTATYEGVQGSGKPLVKDWYADPDSAVIADFAWHDKLMQSPTPLDDEGVTGRKDLLAALTQANPNMKRIALVGGGIWPIQYPDTLTFYGDVRATMDRVKGFVSYAPGVFDFANPRAVDALSALWKKWVCRAPWQGVMIDGFGGYPPDDRKFAEAGFSSQAAYREAWRKGWLLLAERLRRDAPKGFWLGGNGGPPDSVMGQHFDGWMMENWPHQSGGFAMMEKARRWFNGPMVVFTLIEPGGFTGPNAAKNQAKWDYAAATACLFDCILVGQPGDAVSTHAQKWWEWKPAKWALGKATGEAYLEGNTWRRHFERGAVWAEPSFNHYLGRGGAVFADSTITAVPS